MEISDSGNVRISNNLARAAIGLSNRISSKLGLSFSKFQNGEAGKIIPLILSIYVKISTMRVLIISDIHANLTALDAVIADAGEFDAVWFLGDLVGYGPDPNECVERVQTLTGLVALTGNHDAATLDKLSTESFNHDARRAVQWTQNEISPENLSYLGELAGKVQVTDDVI